MAGAAQRAGARVTVVIATRDRAGELCRTLGRLAALPAQPPVIVVDNASSDGTPRVIRERHPGAGLVELPRNIGAAARNEGARRAATPYVAFSDDDSWWAPGALPRAVAALDGCGGLGLVAARTLVGPAQAEDPVNAQLRASPLPRDDLPGPRVLGFLACAAVVRRAAFLAVGGFSELLMVGGEETLLALDLAAAGWAAAYLDEVVAVHWPSARRDSAARARMMARNEVLTAWQRRPAAVAARQTLSLAARAPADPVAAGALAGVARALPRALLHRRKLPAAVEEQVRMLGRAQPPGRGRRV
jgi:GT2 family glycosyltransferase